MNTDNLKPTCMYCDKLIADTSAPDRFCSRACFDTLLEEVKAQWDQRYQEAKANGNGASNGAERERKPLSEIMQGLKARKPERLQSSVPSPPSVRRGW